MYFCFTDRTFKECNKKIDKIAIRHPDRNISWSELFENTQKIYKQLPILNQQRFPLLIMGHKQPEYIYYILACLQQSVPYVPLDTIYPQQRVENIKQQFNRALLIDLKTKIAEPFEGKGAGINTEPNNPLAYILFTSGSTGTPKGVKIHQRAIQDFYQWVCSDFPFTDKSVVLSPSLFTFDVSLLEIMGSIGRGGTLQLVNNAITKDKDRFLRYLAEGQCSDWVSTPSFVNQWLLSKAFDRSSLPSLKNFILIGEALPHQLAIKLNERFHDGCTHNAYGPTEATVVVTLGKMTNHVIKSARKSLPLGEIKPSSHIFIIDKHGLPCSDRGEIVIAGNNVSSGYLDENLPANSNFFTYNKLPAYKTGDYGYIDKGILHYCGRLDEQIKLNGYRIEIKEIEAVINQEHDVFNCAVLALQRNSNVIRMIAYIFVDKASHISQLEPRLNETLQKKLPSYMMPSELLFGLSKNIPTSEHAKVDKKNLLELYQKQHSEQLLK